MPTDSLPPSSIFLVFLTSAAVVVFFLGCVWLFALLATVSFTNHATGESVVVKREALRSPNQE